MIVFSLFLISKLFIYCLLIVLLQLFSFHFALTIPSHSSGCCVRTYAYSPYLQICYNVKNGKIKLILLMPLHQLIRKEHLA